jgi:transcriptional regulator with XRE-family HTH domain
MDINTRRVNYILTGRTQEWLASQIGVSQSTISRIANGLSTLKSEFVDVLRNTYQREAYSNLKASGTSSSQAKRFSWYIPEHVLQVQEKMLEVRSMLEVTWVANKSKQEGRMFSTQEIERILEEARPKILASLQKSKKPIEEFVYPKGQKLFS